MTDVKHILITGGCGFIGSSLAVALAGDGHKVTCFDNLSRRGSERLLTRVRGQGCHFVHGDIRNAEDLAKIPGDPHLMIECSAEPSVLMGALGRDAWFMVNNNLVGSLQCFEYARERNLSTIFLSTSRVYPYDALNKAAFREDPTRFSLCGEGPGLSAQGVAENFPLEGARSLYGATKLAGEIVLQEYSCSYAMPSIINRLGVIAGPWQLGKVDQGVFTYWMLGHVFRRPLSYIGFGGQGKQVRDLLHIDDLCDLVRLQVARCADFRGQVFNAGGGLSGSLSLQETTEHCAAIVGAPWPVGSKLETRPADVRCYVSDNSRVCAEFGWQPRRSPRRILEETFAWMQQHRSELEVLL